MRRVRGSGLGENHFSTCHALTPRTRGGHWPCCRPEHPAAPAQPRWAPKPPALCLQAPHLWGTHPAPRPTPTRTGSQHNHATGCRRPATSSSGPPSPWWSDRQCGHDVTGFCRVKRAPPPSTAAATAAAAPWSHLLMPFAAGIQCRPPVA